MYGSYGSYSSMSSASSPMDIAPRQQSSYVYDAHCAFPSWPRRDSLSSDREERPTSYLSDDDLFLSDPFDDDSHSISSASSTGSPAISPPRAPTEFELLNMQREKLALQKEYVRQMVAEKEQRRRAAQKQQKKRSSSSSSSRKSPKPKHSSMAPIAE